jgi:sulfatase modifying factor 1
MNAARLLLTLIFFCLTVTPAYAQSVIYELVPVGDAGNANDTTGYGGVAYEFQIGKYEVTIGQYVAFLNAVAKDDTYSLYSSLMASMQSTAGISRAGTTGSFTYTAIGPIGATTAGADSPTSRPITFVTWFDTARFANWLSNGQPTGGQGPSTTENGAYALNGAISGTAPAMNALNPNTGSIPLYRIPTENEWYKAAYYKGSGTNAGYWDYATQSDVAPGNTIGSGTNQANYAPDGVFSITQSSTSSSQNYLTNVGAFSGSPSAYGTYDQSGNVYEWNDLTGAANASRGLRGGNWNGIALGLSSTNRYAFNPSMDFNDGFRLASPVAVPEPSTYAMALAGLACGGYSMFGRRKRA